MKKQVEANATQRVKRPGGVTGKGFRPGQSGSPGGMSKEKRDFLTRLTTDDADEVYTALMDLVRERNAPAVLRAWEYVVGKPKERHEHTGRDGGPINVKAEPSEPLSTDELRDLAASYLSATAGVASGASPESLDAPEADDEAGNLPSAAAP